MSKSNEVARAAIKGAVENIPIAGGFLASLIDIYLPDFLKTRRERFLNQLATEIETLIQARNAEQLFLKGENQMLLVKLIRLIDAEVEEAKLEELRNVYLNAVIEENVDVVKKIMFMSFVAELSTKHLSMLKLMDDPRGILQEKNVELKIYMGGVEDLFEKIFTDYRSNEEFYRTIYNELQSKQLLIKGLGVTMTLDGVLTSRTTNFGKDFLKFISSPKSN